ncbi:sigma-70 family RNA polymerase sigma factor [Mediterraneibacter glycyrrhizinilyticus]|uniref:sigma-70 family RNA polymerase sigma factor n=1 Tax=Mediterraneibacter glycyrrhizinilyticus TaxID=342942 RepID=UPI00265B016C|nr:sigma-70 family RNA polymerase sigma factor [Mediterraneibacter glycyrrhizinilyticus]MCF2570129.1 sigma-70 family RNA polymerase sigma factor [Mediterraneibacter glycyrrhizinilyticus]
MTNEELVERIQAGDEKGKYLYRLWEQNYPFIKKIASKYSAVAEFEDLIQEGYIGLHTAAMKYDPQCGVLFLSYAGYWIQQKMIRYLQQNGNTVRIPVHMVEMLSKYKRISEQFQTEYGREPTELEYAALLNIRQDNVGNIPKAACVRNLQSLSAQVGESEDELGDFISSDVNVESIIIHEMEHERMSRILRGIIAQLSEKKQKVMKMKLEGFSPKEAGHVMGMTEKQVSRMESDVRRRIRLDPKGKALREYYMQYI